ncbi:MAG TPA: cation-translocating P-type ATPase C-terminal domain-containing protein, partial [Acidimicrobiales bacterium]
LTFVALGWRPGEAFPGGDTAAAASGAAFLTVVVAQTANAFACRSATRSPGALGWTTNRLLIAAVAIEGGLSLAMLLIGPVARVLEHANPPLVGWLVALAAAAALLAGDALDKRRRRARSPTAADVVAGAGRPA